MANASTSVSAPLRLSVRWGSGVSGRDFRDAAVLAERYGFDQIWSGNEVFQRSGIIPYTLALDATERIEVGSSVLNPVSMHAVDIADITASLQDFSGGRFVLGIGAGSQVRLPWAGLNPPPPVVRTRRALRAVRALLEGRSPADVPGAGEGWQPMAKLADGACAPTRIYLGSMGPKMLQLAGREADGVIALCLPPTRFHWVQEQIDIGSDGAERPFDLGCGLWVSIDEDRDLARGLLAELIAKEAGALSDDALEGAGYDLEKFTRIKELHSSGRVAQSVALVDNRMLRLGIAGNVSDVIDQCLDLIDQGARHISFGGRLGPRRLEAIELIGSRVLPELRKKR